MARIAGGVAAGKSLLCGQRTLLQLQAVLAGVAGAGKQAGAARHLDVVGEGVVFGGVVLNWAQLAQDGLGLRALQGDLRDLVGDVLKLDVAAQVGADPVGVLLMVGRVDDHHVAVVVEAVNHHVVHNAAPLVAHRAVADLAVCHVGKVVGQQHLGVCQRVGTFEHQLRHVGDVKQASLFADRHVFGDDAGGVLHRQAVAAKRHHLAAQRDVAIV